MSRYLKPRDHGYLMEAAACIKVLEDLRHIEAKYARTVEKEGAVRQAEFEKVMQYHSERELQDDFGWGFITEAQYDRYRLFFSRGRLPWSSCRRQRANWLCAWCAASWRILTQIAGSGSFLHSPRKISKRNGHGPSSRRKSGAKNRGAETEARYHRGRRGHGGRVITISRTVYQGGYG